MANVILTLSTFLILLGFRFLAILVILFNFDYRKDLIYIDALLICEKQLAVIFFYAIIVVIYSNKMKLKIAFPVIIICIVSNAFLFISQYYFSVDAREGFGLLGLLYEGYYELLFLSPILFIIMAIYYCFKKIVL